MSSLVFYVSTIIGVFGITSIEQLRSSRLWLYLRKCYRSKSPPSPLIDTFLQTVDQVHVFPDFDRFCSTFSSFFFVFVVLIGTYATERDMRYVVNMSDVETAYFVSWCCRKVSFSVFSSELCPVTFIVRTVNLVVYLLHLCFPSLVLSSKEGKKLKFSCDV